MPDTTLRQLSSDEYECVGPGGGRFSVSKDPGSERYRACGREWGSLAWAKKAVERLLDARPELDTLDPTLPELDDLDLSECPAGWVVLWMGRPTRCTIQSVDISGMAPRPLPLGVFRVIAVGVHRDCRGLDNATVHAMHVIRALRGVEGGVWSS